MSMFDLTGKTALVTGVKRGIGRGMAEALAAAGADIIGVSASLEASGSDVEKAVTAMGRKFTAHQCDFSDRAAVTKFAADMRATAPDILVNNAGTILRKPAAEHGDDLWDEVIEVNLNAQFVLSREVGAAMVARGSGKIIFTASLLTFQGGITVPRMGRAGRQRQRHRAGLYRDGQHPSLARRSSAIKVHPRAYSRRTLGRA